MRAHIDSAEDIVLIAHLHPDADSLGCACAMYAHLLRLQKPATLFCADETIDERLGCIPWSEAATSKWNEKADLAIAFDCGSYLRLGVRPHCRVINVDHHSSNDGFGDVQLMDTDAVSTASILTTWFKNEGIKINPKMATALYAGIADDTLGFMSRRTDGTVFETAAALAGSGADITAVNTALFRRRPLASLRLKGRLFSALRLISDGRICVIKVTRAMLEESGGAVSACDEVLSESLGLPTVRVALLLRERRDGSIKVSLRTDDGIDVHKIALAYGGGGHHYAAGFIASDIQIDLLADRLSETIVKEME